jgi:glycosyltransferase involved in cell wall biosynthesis
MTSTRCTFGPNKLISTIIPTYNRRQLLDRAVKSVFAQTFRPIEIVIVDDGSHVPVTTDWFQPIPEGVSLSLIRNAQSCGPAAARNSGIEHSTGDWIAFLDDDDYWEPEKLASQLAALESANDSGILAVACQMTLVDDNQEKIGQTRFPAAKAEIIAGMVFADRNLNPSTLLVARSAFATVGLFDPSLPTAEDRHWLLRYLMRFDVLMLDRYLTNYAQHDGPSLTRNFDAMLKGEIRFMSFIGQHTNELNVNHRRAMAYRLAKLANEFMLARQWQDGIRHFAQAILASPFEHRAWAGLGLALLGPDAYRRALSFRMRRARSA